MSPGWAAAGNAALAQEGARGRAAEIRRARRPALAASAEVLGLDYITLLQLRPTGARLRLCFVPRLGPPSAVRSLSCVTPDNLRLLSEAPGPTPRVRSVTPVGPDALEVELSLEPVATQPTYRLQLVGLAGVDPFFSGAPVRLDAASAITPFAAWEPEAECDPDPLINYLARDFESLRQAMFDRMALLAPSWQERSAADLGVMLVEVLAYAADYQSYFQDAVLTEAFIDRARRRISARRHAVLRDYALWEGSNARTWIVVEVDRAETLPRGTAFATGYAGWGVRVEAFQLDDPPAGTVSVFESLETLEARPGQHELTIYAFGSRDFSLPRGTTRCVLQAEGLRAGQVLIFEQIRAVRGVGDLRERRAAVRLVEEPRPWRDELLRVEGLFEVRWHPEDALPFELPVAVVEGDRVLREVSVARGNVVLADHGRTHPAVHLPPVPAAGDYTPTIAPGLTFALPYAARVAGERSAGEARLPGGEARSWAELQLSSRSCWLPDDGPRRWEQRATLLESGPFARHYVVEVRETGVAQLRFGDGQHGRRPAPGEAFTARWRRGGGLEGNVGPDTIDHVVCPPVSGGTGHAVRTVRNPLAACGGTAPETLDNLRIMAPGCLRERVSCVTLADYAARAREAPEVERAAAELVWQGSWEVCAVYVERRGGLPCDAHFLRRVEAHLREGLLADQQLSVRAPRYVPLAIQLEVWLQPRTSWARVQQALLASFAPLFRRDSAQAFGFGARVVGNELEKRACQETGVRGAEIKGMERLCEPRSGRTDLCLAAGEIPLAANDPMQPQLGFFELMPAKWLAA